MLNRERAVDYLNMLDRLYVFDGFAGWDPEVRSWTSLDLWMCIITSHAGQFLKQDSAANSDVSGSAWRHKGRLHLQQLVHVSNFLSLSLVMEDKCMNLLHQSADLGSSALCLLTVHLGRVQSRIKVRVYFAHRAYHALFMYNMLIRPTDEELLTFGKPDFTIFNAGAFPSQSLHLIHVFIHVC